MLVPEVRYYSTSKPAGELVVIRSECEPLVPKYIVHSTSQLIRYPVSSIPRALLSLSLFARALPLSLSSAAAAGSSCLRASRVPGQWPAPGAACSELRASEILRIIGLDFGKRATPCATTAAAAR